MEHDELTFNTTPNILTTVRMGFVPLVVALLYFKTQALDIAAAAAFTIAAITDYFDGYIARRDRKITVYGKLMDPLADKFLVVSSLVMLQDLQRIPALLVMLLICRELAITGLRALASAEGLVIPASPGAKWKTATQMVGIPFLMVNSDVFHLGFPVLWIGQVLITLSVGLSLWSGKEYVVDFFRALRKRIKRKNSPDGAEKLPS